MYMQGKKYYLNKDQEKEKLINRFPLIALLEPNSESGRVYEKHVYKRENGASSYTASATPAPRAAPRTAKWNSPTY
ncbi:hypothetical protein Tco_0120453, partial [Tanacetum coccineum]